MITIQCSVADFIQEMLKCLDMTSDQLDELPDEQAEKMLTRAFATVYEKMLETMLILPDVRTVTGKHLHHLTIHAQYDRPLHLLNHTFQTLITRLMCEDGHTHAVLLSFMVPYSSEITDDYISAIEDIDSPAGNQLDSDKRTHMRWHYAKHWLKLFKVPEMPVKEMPIYCFKNLFIQFMQMRCTCNYLYYI